MKRNEALKKEAIQHLKSILNQTLPLCKDGNCHEQIFQEINRKTHQSLWIIEQLGVQELV
jgi:hypothetical protein